MNVRDVVGFVTASGSVVCCSYVGNRYRESDEKMKTAALTLVE